VVSFKFNGHDKMIAHTMVKPKISKKIRNTVLVCLSLVAIFVYFQNKTSVMVLVRKVEVQNREIRKTVSASGRVKSNNQADLSFLANGDILKINVKENDFVKKGQLLAYIDSSVQSNTVQSAKDARDMALRERDLFVDRKKDNKRILGGNNAYNIKLRSIEESISQAEAAYKAQLSLLSNYSIYAPFDGTVIGVYKKEGEVAVGGSPVLTIANLEDFVFEVVLDQEDFGQVKDGQEVEVTLDAYPDAKLKGNVSFLSSFADPTLGGFLVKSSFDKNGKDVKVGMTGDVYMITEKTEDKVPSLIFNEIYHDEDDKPFVWILDGKKIKKLPIEVGLEGDMYTEIKTDLSGKTILTPVSDEIKIKDGFNARIIN